DRADDGGDVGDQAAFADFAGDAQVREARRAGANAQRNLTFRRAADDVKAHLPARAFGLDIRFASGEVLRQFDAVRAGRLAIFLQSLPDDLDALDNLHHADVIAVPAIAQDRFARRLGERRDDCVEVVAIVAAILLGLAQVPVGI